jgi:hypothetical protein
MMALCMTRPLTQQHMALIVASLRRHETLQLLEPVLRNDEQILPYTARRPR